ncbi:HNH endonuclease family protein [Phytomonospora sp. NPDC050363]|uniref:HNH endonuclease family protein n=1 Tax=Phytomonospora sp. NPDC050363 TaxID=3155642 RepID=UPI00340AA240
MKKALVGTLCAVALTACGVLLSESAQAETISLPLKDAIAELQVADEDRTGYDRDKFEHWVDEDGDGCNTRYEVLIAEAVEAPDVSGDCQLSGGSWFSYYDGATWTAPADLDIDHFVPLAEAWDSGASDWTAEQREQFANDLGDDRDLIAVTDNANQEKSDQDPAEWMPSVGEVHCQYISEWVAVKLRWRLTIDEGEKSAIESISADCGNDTITVETAI